MKIQLEQRYSSKKPQNVNLGWCIFATSNIIWFPPNSQGVFMWRTYLNKNRFSLNVSFMIEINMYIHAYTQIYMYTFFFLYHYLVHVVCYPY